MKRFASFTICALLAATLLSGGVTANAADGGTIYPEDEEFTKTLSFSSLTDYAAEDGVFAFADGNNVIVYDGGNRYPYAAGEVASVDIVEGKIYYGCADGKAYALPEQTECEHTFPVKTSEILYDGYYYFTDESGLNIFNKSTKENKTYEGGYDNLKLYGDTVYAIEGNVLYSFTGAERSEIVLEYSTDIADVKITIGQAASALKRYSPPQLVSVAENAVMTSVDLENLGGQYFDAKEITRAKENTTALLLCYSGNAAIVSIGDTAYALLKSKVTETETDLVQDKPFENAQMIGGNIYASPFVVSGTVLTSDATGITVNVLNRIECEDVLGCAFYEVEYKSGEETLKGYVAEGFLSKVIIEDNKKPVEKEDPAYSESNDTKTILIIFAVVLLVLAAIAYISHVTAKGKGKKKKKTDSEE